MEVLLQDLRLSLRRLMRQPLFTATAVLSLALGIGANSAVFSVLDAVLLRPLPYAGPERLALLWEVFPDSGNAQLPSGEINLPIWRQDLNSLQSLASAKLFYRTLTQPGEPRRLDSWDVSGNLFQTLGVRAALGRTLQEQDAILGAPAAVVLSHETWASRFGGDPAIVGRSLWLDGQPHQVVGVMSEDFYFPPPLRILGDTHQLAAEIFVPARIDPAAPDPRRNLVLLARLQPDVALRQAQGETRTRASLVAEAFPQYNPAGLSATLAPLHGQAVAEARPGLLLMSAAVGLVLLICCLNVASLLLARGASSVRETAIRAALGAGRLRLFRQHMTESLLLALLGGVLGTLLALWGVELLTHLARAQIPEMGAVVFSGRVLAFCWTLALLTALIFGLIPALRASRGSRCDLLTTREAVSSIRPHLRAALVVCEVALATVLLVSAGLLGQSLWNLRQVELGFQPERLLTVDLVPSQQRYPLDGQVLQLLEDLRENALAVTGVQAAGAVSGLPLSGDREGLPIEVEGRSTATLEERMASMTALRAVTPGYFAAMGVPLLAGRDLVSADGAESEPVVLVDRSFADRFLAGRQAVGRRLAFEDDRDPNAVWRRIVGVVEDVRQESLHRDPQFVGTVYVPYSQQMLRTVSLVVRTQEPFQAASRSLTRRFRQIDPQLALRIAPLTDLVESAVGEHRSPALFVAAFAVIAVSLAVVGLYGVIAFIVARGRREIGVRMALGASRGRILRQVLSRTISWSLLGILLGTLVSLAATRSLTSLLYDVPPLDPLTYLASAVLFIAIALLATYLPAHRASRIDPSVALREE